MTGRNVIDVLYGRRSANEPAFVIPGGVTLSTGDVLKEIDRASGALAACGVKPGDRVSIRVEKCVAAVFVAHACFKIGAILHPVNDAYTVREVEALLEDAKPSLFVCDPGELEIFSNIATARGVRLESLCATGGSFADLAAESNPVPATASQTGDSAASLLYTSGTTGRPKGALITHHNLAESANALAKVWKLGTEDVLLHALPTYHAHGLLTSINVMLASGGAIWFLPRFSTEGVLAELARCTVMMGVPTHYARLLREPCLPAAIGKKFRLAISGSAPLPQDIADRFRQLTGMEIIERYGSTEAAIVTAVTAGVTERRGWVGWPLPGVDVRVANADGRFGRNAVGVLETRGHNVFAGYWRNEVANGEAFTEDGWFRTGDIAEIDGEGCVRLLGREKDLIISGGLNVYPKEVEDALDRCDGVEVACVFGVPHPDFGEAVVAAVETDSSGSFDEGECMRHLKTELAPYKVPKRIVVLDAIERNELGKVVKAPLRENFRNLFSGQGNEITTMSEDRKHGS